MLEDRYTMMVSVLAVDPRHRRRGVARRLLERVAAEERWQVEWLQVTTWCPRNVDIYEQLGFSVFAHDEGDEVACWTMLRPGPDHEPDVGHPPTGSP